jgi:hypothetical protein
MVFPFWSLFSTSRQEDGCQWTLARLTSSIRLASAFCAFSYGSDLKDFRKLFGKTFYTEKMNDLVLYPLAIAKRIGFSAYEEVLQKLLENPLKALEGMKVQSTVGR